MELVKAQNLQQLSFGFELALTFEDFRELPEGFKNINEEDDTWKVVIVKPDGRQLIKTGEDVRFPEDDIPKIAVRIDPLDLDRRGVYSYQVIKTTNDVEVKAVSETFEVLAALPENLEVAPPSSANADHFPIYDATGKFIKSDLYVDGGVLYFDGLAVGEAAVTPAASETVAGKAEIATQTETNTGTDNARIVTPAKLANWSGKIKRFNDVFGDGSNITFVINHNLNQRYVAVEVWETATPYRKVDCEVRFTDQNNITLVFNAAPSEDGMMVTIIG